MTRLLRSLPYYGRLGRTPVAPIRAVAPGVSELVLPYQIIVWVSITPAGVAELPPTARRFPAILDTGHSDAFAIKPAHLRAWTGLPVTVFPVNGRGALNGIQVPTRQVRLWVHPHVDGCRDEMDPSRPPYLLPLDRGILVYGNYERQGDDPATATLPGPRLPVLGLRALTEAGCQLHIDGHHMSVDLDVPDHP